MDTLSPEASKDLVKRLSDVKLTEKRKQELVKLAKEAREAFQRGR